MFKITAPIKGINGPTTFGTVPVNFMDSVGYAREVPAAVRAYLDSAGYKVEQTDTDDAVQAPDYAGMNVDEFVAAYADADAETRAAMLDAEAAGKDRKGIAEAVARIDAEPATDGDTATE